MDKTEALNITQAARVLGISRANLSRRVAAGELPAFRSVIDNRAVYLPRCDVERLRAREFVPVRAKEEAASAA